MTSAAYWRAADIEDEQLDGILAGIRSREDAGMITVRQAADQRIRALEDHLAAVQELQGAAFPAHPDPDRPAGDPCGIVSTVLHDLARNGVKSRFGAEVSLTTAAGGAATMPDALGVSPVVGDDDPVQYTVTAPVQPERRVRECPQCGGTGTAPTHVAGCPLAGEPA